MRQRVFIDTNVYVGCLLRPSSAAGRATAKAWERATTLVSSTTEMELRAMLARAQFAPYVKPGSMEPFLKKIQSVGTQIEVRSTISASRDPRDDKFLEVAVHGRADAIVTGDKRLLALNPFRGVEILSPAEYLDKE
jgi:uncharacterized protein